MFTPKSEPETRFLGSPAFRAETRFVNKQCTYRKTGFEEAQPDVSFDLDSNAELIPWETTIIDLDQY